MNVREFRPSDTKSTNKWLQQRGREDLKTECCTLGLIIPGVVAVQLLHAENGLVIMDSLVSNPYVSSNTRHKAMDTIYAEFIKRAKALGYRRIIGFASSTDTLSRSLRHGFIRPGHVFLAREL